MLLLVGKNVLVCFRSERVMMDSVAELNSSSLYPFLFKYVFVFVL